MSPPVFGITGWKNSGKTTLTCLLVEEFARRGHRVATVKHAHHLFDADQEGTDSYRHRQAGAGEVAIVSSRRWAILHELGEADEPSLTDILAKLSPCDLVLIEGYKRDDHAKIEAHRAATGQPLIAPGDPTVQALASDTVHPEFDRPVIDLNATAQIADFILEKCDLIQ